MSRPDFLAQANAAYIEGLQEDYRRDPESVPYEWQIFFAGVEAASGAGAGTDDNVPATSVAAAPAAQTPASPTLGVFDLIHSYRELGHLIANLDPLGANQTHHELLELSEFGFEASDLDRVFECPTVGGAAEASLRDLVLLLRATYCGTLGVEYMHIADKEQRSWLQEQIEPSLNTPEMTELDRRHLFRAVSTANLFEQFIHTKYVGQKRFSLEGGESLIPLLNTLIDEAGALGVEEVVMGMPHRGRLNVMANILGKPCELIFSEYEGAFLPNNIQGDGDVKYHLGYARDHVTRAGKKVHISLLSNPSHLEAIDPVVEGIVHAKQEYLRDTETRTRVVPLLLHGDAAFTGQGIVAETLALSELKPFHNGGTVHIVINNQIGFTTSPSDSRFTNYPSDLAKFINAPVLHVNADDPEAAVQAARLAVAFRARFHEDVIIDLVCYRRHGHNELDDPTFTQPALYKTIRAHTPVHKIYAEQLRQAGVLGEGEAEDVWNDIRQRFEDALEYARDAMPKQRVFAFGGAWEGMGWAGKDWRAHTAVSMSRLQRVMDGITRAPKDFNLHPKIAKLNKTRAAMLDGEGDVDWATAEALAFGTLLLEGTNVRLSGQDSARGTFSQRHAVFHDMENDRRHVPLNKLGLGQARFRVIDTMLSENAVLGFEYGYSSADPRNLVLWEAQYGDFANGAQVIIDQFIVSAESKWQRQSGIVLLLPHGYEGQGPEHSSARLERYLQMCAEDNVQVCTPTTPAQYFHALRRQIHRRFRKPLILMTPKSMLRMKLCTSGVAEFTGGGFQRVIDEIVDIDPSSVRRVLLCSGKVYYDLLLAREERVAKDVAILRVEQLYPFPDAELTEMIATFPEDAEVCWVQEESKNMGAWNFVSSRLAGLLAQGRAPLYVGRDEAASPATGSYKLHQQELDQFLNDAFRKPATQRKQGKQGKQGKQESQANVG
jgi:2-oxoglutarate dehydrogenase E1 component